jgi:hypothetical protein
MWRTFRHQISSVLPWANCGIAGTALWFQTNILYPWHNDLSKDIQKVHRDTQALRKLLEKN